MRAIDGDALEKFLSDAEIEATRQRKYVFASALNTICGNVRNFPTIEPEQKWILCSETVDIPDHEILACDKYGEEMFGYLAYEDEQWLCESDGCMMYDPIAWREKPEPYKEKREE